MQINTKTLSAQQLKDFRIAKVKQALEVKIQQQKEDKESFELAQNVKPNSPNKSIILNFGLMKPEISCILNHFLLRLQLSPNFY